MHRTPVRRPNGKDFKRLISGVACVGVGVRVRGGDSVKCGVRVQVGPRLKVRVGDGAGEFVGYGNGQDRVAEEGKAGVGVV